MRFLLHLMVVARVHLGLLVNRVMIVTIDNADYNASSPCEGSIPSCGLSAYLADYQPFLRTISLSCGLSAYLAQKDFGF